MLRGLSNLHADREAGEAFCEPYKAYGEQKTYPATMVYAKFGSSINYLFEIIDRLYVSRCSRAIPVPFATQ